MTDADAAANPPDPDPLRTVARLYRAWARLRPAWVRTPPPPHADGAPHPTLRRRPRDPWVPAPPPHLDPDLTDANPSDDTPAGTDP